MLPRFCSSPRFVSLPPLPCSFLALARLSFPTAWSCHGGSQRSDIIPAAGRSVGESRLRTAVILTLTTTLTVGLSSTPCSRRESVRHPTYNYSQSCPLAPVRRRKTPLRTRQRGGSRVSRLKARPQHPPNFSDRFVSYSDVLLFVAVWLIRWRKNSFWLGRKARSQDDIYYLAHSSLPYSFSIVLLCLGLQGFAWCAPGPSKLKHPMTNGRLQGHVQDSKPHTGTHDDLLGQLVLDPRSSWRHLELLHNGNSL